MDLFVYISRYLGSYSSLASFDGRLDNKKVGDPI